MRMKFENRSVFGWGPTKAGWANPKNGMVVHFDGSRQGLASKSHTACRNYWKNTRQFHMGPSRGWADIGYSFGCCPHGVILEGRGLNHVQAAQPGGNATWYSVTFMSGPGEKPTDAQIDAFQELRAWLRGKGVGSPLKGHRNFISTDCPGQPLYGMVTSGELIKPRKPVVEEEGVKQVCALALKGAVEVEAGKRKSVPYSIEYLDPEKMHTDATPEVPLGYPSVFPKKSGDYMVQGSVGIDGLKPGDRVALIIAAYERDTNKLVSAVQERTLVGDAHGGIWDDVFTVTGLDTDHKYRLDVDNPNDYSVTIKFSRLTVAT